MNLFKLKLNFYLDWKKCTWYIKYMLKGENNFKEYTRNGSFIVA